MSKLVVVAYIRSTSIFFFFNDTATTEIYTLSLHDAHPISQVVDRRQSRAPGPATGGRRSKRPVRSEEHTSELQSRFDLVCRLLLEKKKRCDILIRNLVQTLLCA